MIKVAVIGYGHLGKWHCDKVEVCENSELYAIVELNIDSQKMAKEKHPHTIVTADLTNIIDQIDAAIVVTPTSFHFEVVKQLLVKNKHVFCEKPLCTSSEEASELKKIKNSSVVLQVGHSERFHAIVPRLSDIISCSKYFTMRLSRKAPFKGRATDVDVVQDLMIHDIDLMLHTTKRFPISVSAQGYKNLTDNYDDVFATFEFDGGSSANIHVSRSFSHEERLLEFTDLRGTYSVDLFRNKTFSTFKDDRTPENFVREESYEKRDHLLIEHEYFYQSILEKKEAIVNVDDGASAVLLIEKVLLAVELKKKIVL